MVVLECFFLFLDFFGRTRRHSFFSLYVFWYSEKNLAFSSRRRCVGRGPSKDRNFMVLGWGNPLELQILVLLKGMF